MFRAIRSVRDFFSSGFDQKILDIGDWVVRQLVRLGGLLDTVGLEISPEKLRETLVTSAREGGRKPAEILGGLASGTPQLVLASFFLVIGLYFSLRDGKGVTRRLAALPPFSAPDVYLFATGHPVSGRPVVAACALWALVVHGRSKLAVSAPRSTLTLE